LPSEFCSDLECPVLFTIFPATLSLYQSVITLIIFTCTKSICCTRSVFVAACIVLGEFNYIICVVLVHACIWYSFVHSVNSLHTEIKGDFKYNLNC